MTYDNTEEQPLDPVMERVRKKMIRLMVISIGIMMIGLLAVLFAIIYKFSNPSEPSVDTSAGVPGQASEINLGLPSSSEVLSTNVEAGRIVLDVKAQDGGRQLIILDAASGKLIATVNVN